MEKSRDDESFRTSTDVYSGLDTDYQTSYQLEEDIDEDQDSAKKPAKKKKKRRKKHYMLRLLVLIAVIVAVILFLNSSIFAIAEIEVKNNSLISDKDILKTVGITEGDNLFHWTGHKVSKTLKDNPYIDSVSIDRKLPDTFIITVNEKIPTLAVKYKDGYIILDDSGCAIDFAKKTMTATLLSGISVKSYEVGKIPAFEDDAEFKEMLDLVNAVNKSGMYFKKLEISSDLEVKGYVTDTLMCSGNPENIAENLEGIKVALYDLDKKGIKRGVIQIGENGYSSFSPITE